MAEEHHVILAGKSIGVLYPREQSFLRGCIQEEWYLAERKQDHGVQICCEAGLAKQAGGDPADDHAAVAHTFEQALERSQGAKQRRNLRGSAHWASLSLAQRSNSMAS